jgi:hypothetical protein
MAHTKIVPFIAGVVISYLLADTHRGLIFKL